MLASNLRRQTRRVLGTLTPREEQVLRLRFGIGERADLTLEEVGVRFSVTRERIRQIEAKALRKLRHPTRARQLRELLRGVTRALAEERRSVVYCADPRAHSSGG